MKMNAKKLTLALVVLLLALTCVFVACKPDTIVNNNYNCDCPDPVDLEEVADQFKRDYDANYLSLYTDDVATALSAMKAEALLKITSAETLDAAKKLAADYIAELKAARTFVDEVKDLIAKIAVDGSLKHADPVQGVALADEADVELLNYFNARIEDKFITAAGAQEKVVDDYKDTKVDAYDGQTTWEVAKAIATRFRAIKVAELSANAEDGLNDQIKAILKWVEDAKKWTYDGELEGDEHKLTVKDYETLLILQAELDTFAEIHELVEGTEVYTEILRAAELKKADKIFGEKTEGHEQITRARAVVAAARALAEIARNTANDTPTEVVRPQNVGADTYATPVSYFILAQTFIDAQDGEDQNGPTLPSETIVKPVKIVYQGITKWVAKADIYADLNEAEKALNTQRIFEVYISGDPAANDPFRIVIPANGVEYYLDADMQATAEEAADAATAWMKLLATPGNYDLKESLTNTLFLEVIERIVGRYNDSIAHTFDRFNEFKADLLAMNYVDDYPEKDATYNEYLLTTDSQTLRKEDAYHQYWKNTMLDEIAKLMRSADVPYDIETAHSLKDLFTAFEEDYPDNYFLGRDNTGKDIYVNLFDNEDGTYVSSVFYKVYAYKWLVDNLAKNGQEKVNERNTKELAKVIENVYTYFFGGEVEINYYLLAVAMRDWVADYLATLPATTFDLTPFKTVKTERLYADTPVAKFGPVVMTFADEKLEEVAMPQVIALKQQAVIAEPTEALDVTVYADYNVALAAIAEYDRLVQELKDTAAALKSDIRDLFAVGEADAIEKLFADYNAAMQKYANCVVPHPTTANSLVEELKRIDQYNYDRYAEIINTAKDLKDHALMLYPHGEWDVALEGFKAAVEAAQADVDLMDLAISEFNAILEKAETWKAYCEAGAKVGWIDADKDEDGKIIRVIEELRLIDQDTLEAARTRVDVLTKWQFILTDATKFVIDNDGRLDDPVTNTVGRDSAIIDRELIVEVIKERLAEEKAPDVLAAFLDGENLVDFLSGFEFIDEEKRNQILEGEGFDTEEAFTNALEANLEEDELNQVISAMNETLNANLADAVDVALAEFLADDDAVEAAFIEQLTNALSAYLANDDVILVEADEELEIDEVTLISYMVKVLKNAFETVEYVNEDDNIDILAYAKLDKKALDAALAEKEEEYEEAKAEFLATFKLQGKESYGYKNEEGNVTLEIDALAALTTGLDYFVDHAIKELDSNGNVVFADYDYLNMTVTNDYDKVADLFSQIFNEYIMARYYRSILLTVEYAKFNPTTDSDDYDWALMTAWDALNDKIDTSWVIYAQNQLLRVDVKSETTFTSIKAGLSAVGKAWRTQYINYEWAIMALEAAIYPNTQPVPSLNDLLNYIETATVNPVDNLPLPTTLEQNP